jgi:hypothetical protein
LLSQGCLHWSPQSQGEQLLVEARQRYYDDDFSSALEISRQVLVQFPASLADQSLFQIGLIYAHPDNPDRDFQKAADFFQRIIDQYSTSRLLQDTELWQSVLVQLRAQENQIRTLTQRSAALEKFIQVQKRKIYQLQDQLEQLKHIDIKMEEEKRNAIPPAEELKDNKDGKNSGS